MSENTPDNQNYLWIITGVFIALAVSFIFNLWGSPRKVAEINAVDKKFISNDTVRDPLKKPTIQQAGFTYNCNNCHQHITPSKTQQRRRAAHETIKLEHGINKSCYNCHSQSNREMLFDINGKDVPFSKSELLCQKCHGPKYRDWEIGVHGRPSGYWDKSKGKETVKATCVACHNPHSPKFKAIEPAPAPVSIKESFYW
ncbi:hypothetical protein MNBD_UNCLBAC01-870 [hydrothermal vent metagenome]|uniref:Uncharacterized protein n=1 Tax=hydrothermal vent metagenome TaxID=652676 RepID=A0A3B1DJV6_9ZZZZ